MTQRLKRIRQLVDGRAQNITQAVGMFADMLLRNGYYLNLRKGYYHFTQVRSKLGHTIRYPARQYHPDISEKHLAFWEKGRRAEARKLAN